MVQCKRKSIFVPVKIVWSEILSTVVEKGVFIPVQWSNEFPDSESSEKDDSDDDGFNDDLDEMEQCKLRANSEIEIVHHYSPIFTPNCLWIILSAQSFRHWNSHRKISRCM